MNERYANKVKVKQLKTGKLVFNSLRPKSIKPNLVTDITLPATEARRMDEVANRVYGNPESWWKIAAANGKVNGSLYFRPGSTIIIPTK